MKERLKAPELRFPGFTDDWEERKLIDLATTYIGLVTTMTENYTNKGTLLIRNSDIKEGRFDLSNPIYLEEQFAEENKTRRMRKGDVVTVHTGDIGTSAMINSELDGAIGFATITTRPTKELDSNFLAWYFNSNYHKKYAKRMSTGDGRSNYNMKDFNKNVIPTPQIDEQQKIGAFFKQLDDTIALHQRKLDLLKEQKKGYLQKMFPKNGAKVPELRFAGFADDWEEHKVSEITDFHKQGFYTKESYNENKKYYLLRGTDMTSNKLILKDTPKINASEKDYEDFKVLKDDFLIVRSGTVGTYAIVKSDITAIFGSYLINFRFNQSIVLNEFFGLFYQSSLFKSQLNKIIQKSSNVNINAENIKSTNIKFPTIEEQQKIGAFFQSIDDTIALHQRKLDLLKEQKKGFLQQMFI
ncbi:restriction endonuclease subunit S [Lactococcus lactis]|uniref:restriction endonuclease subunit S n=2 Tax=Bacillota TaxID=1239 RepID=UPI001EEEBB03|nr:restriction endonuclease subunit S [Lactococcus lactis]MCG1000052.1 restriction endonuclease subunit S [Lactococcus lactis]